MDDPAVELWVERLRHLAGCWSEEAAGPYPGEDADTPEDAARRVALNGCARELDFAVDLLLDVTVEGD